MTKTVEIIDRGRGPQLATSRITVQDLVPYLQVGSSHADIMRAMPILTVAEIQAVERYVQEHKEDVMEQDRRIRAENAKRQNSPEVEKILQEARDQRLAHAKTRRQQRQEANGEGHSC
jgi:uncharacterized protein (DUF433 family)